MIKLSVQLTENDYIKFNYWFSRRTLLTINLFYAFLIISMLLSVVLGLAEKDKVMLPVIASFILILLGLYFNIGLYFRSKKIYASDALIQKAYSYTITPEYVLIESDSSNSIINWNDLHSVVEAKNYFYIFTGRNKALMLPKRLFAGDAAITELRQLATANMPAQKVRVRR